jgi:hypothetical protein
MGEIPDWLIELADNAENEDSQEDPREETVIIPEQSFEPLPEVQPIQQAESGFLEEPVALMDELRSQVEPLTDEEEVDGPPSEKLQKPITFAGMVPWQLAILSILLFLDIAIIGLLFLLMLGRISLP